MEEQERYRVAFLREVVVVKSESLVPESCSCFARELENVTDYYTCSKRRLRGKLR